MRVCTSWYQAHIKMDSVSIICDYLMEIGGILTLNTSVVYIHQEAISITEDTITCGVIEYSNIDYEFSEFIKSLVVDGFAAI